MLVEFHVRDLEVLGAGLKLQQRVLDEMTRARPAAHPIKPARLGSSAGRPPGADSVRA
jgi:hypothetical protein